MTLPPAIRAAVDRAARRSRRLSEGRVRAMVGAALEVAGLRVRAGDACAIHTREGIVPGEVVGFHESCCLVMPFGSPTGFAPGNRVTSEGRPLEVCTGDGLLGRVVDALGRPLDGGPPVVGVERPVTAVAPPAMQRRRIERPLETGVSAIDTLLTCGRGQRVGLFAGSGVGKSTLLGMITNGCAADVNVIALIGERGREVREFVEEVVGPAGMERTVFVVATADAPAMLRFKGAYTAVTIAEAFREQGKDVLFTMDSVTRFAAAAREIGLAAGEPPTLRGYPPSLFGEIPRLVERLGADAHGTITALLTVLVEGDDLNEPVSDTVRGHLDGHIVLSRSLAARDRYPPIDVLASVSRLMPSLVDEAHLRAASRVRELLAHYEENRDLVQVGAYRRGTDSLLDSALDRMGAIEELIHQGRRIRSIEESMRLLLEAAGSTGDGLQADR